MNTLYRSARADSPHLGHGSFWTTSREHAEWFRAWEARTFPSVGASRIYQTEVALDDGTVADRRVLGTSPSMNESVLAAADALVEAGYAWVLIHEGPIEGQWWTVAVYLGDDPVPARPA